MFFLMQKTGWPCCKLSTRKILMKLVKQPPSPFLFIRHTDPLPAASRTRLLYEITWRLLQDSLKSENVTALFEAEEIVRGIVLLHIGSFVNVFMFFFQASSREIVQVSTAPFWRRTQCIKSLSTGRTCRCLLDDRYIGSRRFPPFIFNEEYTLRDRDGT